MGPRAGSGLAAENAQDAIARFNAQPHGYQASVVDGVTLLSPRSVPERVRILLQRKSRLSDRARSAEETLWEITKSLEPRWGESGVIGSGPMPPPECQELLNRSVRLRGTASVNELLASVARQAPGVAWMLLYDEGDTSSVELGFICPNGTWQRWTVAPREAAM